MKAKRVLASLLTAALIITGLPVTAFAADAEKEWWSDDYSTYFYYVDGVLQESPTKVDKTKPAECEKGTITIYKATKADADGATIEVEADDALGHTYDKGQTTESTATCEKEGYHQRICDRCGKTEDKQIKDPAKGHTAGEPEKENVKEATCVEAGSYDEVIYCEDCGLEISRSTKEIPSTGAHQWKEENTEEKQPTCTEAGSVTVKRTCEICGETETETVTTEALGHDWKLTKTITKATCGKDGKGEFTCSRCKAKETRVIPASGEHEFEEQQVFDDDKFKAPTCTEKGRIVVAQICKNCGEEKENSRVYDKEVDALGHDYQVTTTNATCTLSGETVYTCSRCGDSYKTIDQALGHEFEKDKDGKVIVKETVKKAATCTEKGIMIESRHCTRCGEDFTEEVDIDPLGHTPLEPVKEVIKAATCTEDGSYKEVTYCSVCKKAIETSDPIVEKATGHTFGDVPIEQTCQGALYKCENCPVLKKVADEAIEHDWELTKTTTAPTCTEAGEGTYTCKFCKTTKTEELPALGHDWSQSVKKPTCTEDGIAGGTCSRCKIMRDNETIPALGHTFDASKTTAKAYWDAGVNGKGYILYTTVCSNGCGAKKEQVEFFKAEEDGEETHEVTLNLLKAGEPTEATATYVLKRTSKPTKEATCDKPGEKTVTVTVRHTLPNGKIVADSTSWTEVDEEAPAKGHPSLESVKEKVVAPNCAKETDGSYDLVTKCTVCGKELSRKSVTEKWQHTPAKPVKENEKNKDSDTLPYEYQEVTYCAVCNKELSRVPRKINKNGHVPGETVIENFVDADCKNGREGHYDEVTYCKDCDPKVEIDRVTKPISADHVGEWKYVVLKNATCKEKGSYQYVYFCTRCGETLTTTPPQEIMETDHGAFFTKTVVTKDATCTEEGASADVTYCGYCFEEIERTDEKAVDALGHKALDPVKENEVAATCTEDGSYDEVVYCAVCNEEISRETKTVPALGHTEMEAVKENEVAATCTEEGSYDEVVYCEVCDEEISRETKTVPALGHTAMEAVKENEVAATCTEDGSYDEVVYCEVCNEEISRETKTVESEGHKWDAGVVIKEATPDEKGEMKYTCTVCGETKTEEIDNSGLVKKESTIVLNNKLVYYNGKVQAFDATDAKVNGSKGAVTFEYFSDSKCTNKISAPTNCGNYYAKATVAADSEYAAATSSVAKLRILRVFRGFSVVGKTVTVSAASVKNSNQMIPQSKAVTLRKGNDQVKFVKAIWTYNSPITVDRSGNIQLRKGLKPGTYTVKCKAFTPATRNYLRTVKVYTVTIKVK